MKLEKIERSFILKEYYLLLGMIKEVKLFHSLIHLNEVIIFYSTKFNDVTQPIIRLTTQS